MLAPLQVTRPDTSYQRRFPHLHDISWVDESFELFFRGVAATTFVQAPPEGFYLGRDAFVYESKHVFADGRFDPLTVIDFDAALPLAGFIKPRIKAREYSIISNQDVMDVIFCKAGAGNYGHFLAECAPRLLNIPPDFKKIRLHLPAESASYSFLVLQICQYLGIDAEIRIGSTADLIYLDNFIYLSSVSSHNQRKSSTFRKFRDVVLEIYRIKQSRDRRIAILRPDNEARHITNWIDLSIELAKLDFEFVYPGELSFKHQLKLFASADRVFGSLGAGFTNAIWAGSECISHMIDPGLADFFFWDACSQLGQDFHWQFAGVAQPWDLELSTSNYSVNIDAVISVQGKI